MPAPAIAASQRCATIPAAGIVIEDLLWLTGPAGRQWLAALADSRTSLLKSAQQLRSQLSPLRAHLILEQLDLRQRARHKFARSGEMFFTRRGLEQSTDEHVARYKAARFPSGGPVLDLCCGIGGDLTALADRRPTVGIDRDPAVAILARANVAAYSEAASSPFRCNIVVADAEHAPVEHFAAWHIDPDRRPDGSRTTRVDRYQPSVDAIDRLLAVKPHAAIKLAPAAVLPAAWAGRAEAEWISRGGECRQLVAWFGNLANHPGRRRATMVCDGLHETWSIVGAAGGHLHVAARIGRFLYEPDAAVLAAGLTADLANRHELLAVSESIPYLTGDRRLEERGLAGFEVLESLPLRIERVRAALAARRIGRLEIKKRGIDASPERWLQQLRGDGKGHGALFLTRVAGRPAAILARRLPAE